MDLEEYKKHREDIEERAERLIRDFCGMYNTAINEDMKMLMVWRFHDAPKDLRDLSTNGGDEDWLLLIPPRFNGSIPWSEEGQRFGGFDVDDYKLYNGWTVRIGSHS